MKKNLQIANGFFLIFTIIFNYLSNTGILNGKNIGEVSRQYDSLFTPAGYAFSIWGLIYLLLLGFVIYTGRSLFKSEKNDADDFVLKIGWWFVVSCLTNCLWIVTWLYDYTGISVLILFITLIALLIILSEALNYKITLAQKLLINLPFQIYAGWVSVAVIAAFSAWLTKTGWNGWGISPANWTLILILIVFLINLLMTWKKNAPVFSFVAVWALIAISIANENSPEKFVLAAQIATGILFLSSIYKIIQLKNIS